MSLWDKTGKEPSQQCLSKSFWAVEISAFSATLLVRSCVPVIRAANENCVIQMLCGIYKECRVGPADLDFV